MWELITVLVIFVLTLVALLFYFKKDDASKRQITTVPGLDPADKKTGNLADIAKAGSLHQFLADLHNRFGPIASFWMGEQLTLSISSAELFRQHMGLFDKPSIIFRHFETIIGSKAITLTNGKDGKTRRNVYDKFYSHGSIKSMYQIFNEDAKKVSDDWSTMIGGTHIPLTEHMYPYALRILYRVSYGDYSKDEQKVTRLRNAYEDLFCKENLDGEQPEMGTEERRILDEAKKNLDDVIKDIMDDRLTHPPVGGDYILIDAMLELDTGEQTHSDLIEYLIAGYHTTGSGLVWAIYYLTLNPDVQDRAAQEVVDMIGDEDVDAENTGTLVYLRQVIEETLRCSKVATYAARYSDVETKLGGHVIPAGVPVIHALGVAMQDPKVWPDPERFDPDRFSPENAKIRPALAFSPFGFAGKRKCPGYRFAYAEMTVLLAVILRRYRIKLVGDPDVKRVFRLITTPSQEIWVTIEDRRKL